MDINIVNNAQTYLSTDQQYYVLMGKGFDKNNKYLKYLQKDSIGKEHIIEVLDERIYGNQWRNNYGGERIIWARDIKTNECFEVIYPRDFIRKNLNNS
jgi:hypothetical protein